MKIAIVADTFGKENNGTSITIKRLIDGLVARGHEIVIVSPYKPLKKETHKTYYQLPIKNFYIFNNYLAKNGIELAKADKNIIKKAIMGCDIVHLALPFSASKKAQKICEELKIPHTSATHVQAENVTAHFFLKNSELASKLVYKIMYNTFYKHEKIVHCPSEKIKKILIENGYKMELRVISNGVIPLFKPNKTEKPDNLKDKFVISFVGRYSKEKRHDILIKAVDYSKYRDKIQLIFPGVGPNENKIRSLGNRLPNSPILKFCSKEELAQILNYSDLYVHPSDIEIEAISCLEAISCNLAPIISDSEKSATNLFALTELNKFNHKEILNLTDKIDYFLENPKELIKNKKLYVNFAKQFEINNCIDKMVDLFTDAIAIYKDYYTLLN